jgi:hypothetical protein
MQSQNQDQTQNLSMSFKVERVAAAVYMVTSHLSDREPLKTKLRTLAYEGVEMSYNTEAIEAGILVQNLSVTVSLLQVASKAKLISSQNVGIIVHEVSLIKDILMPSDTKEVIEQSLRSLFTDISVGGYIAQSNQSQLLGMNGAMHATHTAIQNPTMDMRPQGSSMASNQKSGYPVQSTEPVSFQEQSNNRASYFTPAQVSMQKPIKKSEPKQNMSKVQASSGSDDSVKGVLTDRQTTIVKEIRLKGQLTIRDLVDKITGCSEKTIQRELLALVEHGVLKKEGERRWSRYSIGA